MPFSKLPATVFVILLTGMIMGCEDQNSQVGRTIKREGQPNVTLLKEKDPKFYAAIDEARSMVSLFITAFKNPEDSQSHFSVKLTIEDGDYLEHVWCTPVRYEDGKFYATINNNPVLVTSVKLGDEVEVAKDEISDWMFVEDGKLKGGYTLRLIRENLPEDQRAEFDRKFPFKIE